MSPEKLQLEISQCTSEPMLTDNKITSTLKLSVKDKKIMMLYLTWSIFLLKEMYQDYCRIWRKKTSPNTSIILNTIALSKEFLLDGIIKTCTITSVSLVKCIQSKFQRLINGMEREKMCLHPSKAWSIKNGLKQSMKLLTINSGMLHLWMLLIRRNALKSLMTRFFLEFKLPLDFRLLNLIPIWETMFRQVPPKISLLRISQYFGAKKIWKHYLSNMEKSVQSLYKEKLVDFQREMELYSSKRRKMLLKQKKH